MIILKEDFEDFARHCNYRKDVSIGDTGYHTCTRTLKVNDCSIEICPRVKDKKVSNSSPPQVKWIVRRQKISDRALKIINGFTT